MDNIEQGMRRRLTRYGDDEFALFLRKSSIKGLRYGDAAQVCLAIAQNVAKPRLWKIISRSCGAGAGRC